MDNIFDTISYNSIPGISVTGGSQCDPEIDIGATNSRIAKLVATPWAYSSVDLQASTSAFTQRDQARLDSLLYSNFDIVSSGVLLDHLKDYEHKFDEVSRDYFMKWQKGMVNSTPEVHEWMRTYKNLFING